ncbi:MAG: hypothetical protein M0C28_38780 [Candidatus Moduliflexus flocculans]|nr:hypothetical protein [Candidatus Moduliflexus flocculans]
MEPTLAEKFMAEGKLPNLARLKKDGTYARLQDDDAGHLARRLVVVHDRVGTLQAQHLRLPQPRSPDLSPRPVLGPHRQAEADPRRWASTSSPCPSPRSAACAGACPFWKILGEKGIAQHGPAGAHHLPAREVQGPPAVRDVRPRPQGQPGDVRLLHRGRRQGPQARGRRRRPRRAARATSSGPSSRAPRTRMLKKPEEIRLPLDRHPRQGRPAGPGSRSAGRRSSSSKKRPSAPGSRSSSSPGWG